MKYCAYSTELSGERITGYFLEFVRARLGKDWETLCALNRAKFYSLLLKAKEELCTRDYDSVLLDLDSISELDSVVLSQNEFFDSFRNKLPLKKKLEELIEGATGGKAFSRLFFCGSASRHVLVRNTLEAIAKEKQFRTSEVMNADESVVSGLVFSQLPLDNDSPYANTQFFSTKSAVNVDKNTVISIEDPELVKAIPIDPNYDKRFKDIQETDRQMESASKEYMDKTVAIGDSVKE